MNLVFEVTGLDRDILDVFVHTGVVDLVALFTVFLNHRDLRFALSNENVHGGCCFINLTCHSSYFKFTLSYRIKL